MGISLLLLCCFIRLDSSSLDVSQRESTSNNYVTKVCKWKTLKYGNRCMETRAAMNNGFINPDVLTNEYPDKATST